MLDSRTKGVYITFAVIAIGSLSAQVPQISQVVDSITGLPQVTPGGFADILGESLGPTFDLGQQPTTSTASVLVGGMRAPVLAQSANQVTIQVPVELPVSTTWVTVSVAAAQTPRIPIQVSRFSPGLPIQQDSLGRFFRSSGITPSLELPVTHTSPAYGGQELLVSAVGLGPTVPAIPTGNIAPASPLALTSSRPTLSVGPTQAVVSQAFLQPGTNGSYLVRFVLPTNLDPGLYPVRLTIGSASSNTVYLPVGKAPEGGCLISTIPAESAVASTGGVFSVAISASSPCAWTLEGVPDWITPSVRRGTGSMTTTLRVSANTSDAVRAVALTIGGHSLHVSQEALSNNCLYSLSQDSVSVDAEGGLRSVEVIVSDRNCSWTPITSANWTQIRTVANSGNGRFAITIDANRSLRSRSTQIRIANRLLVITQQGVPECSFSIQPSQITASSSGGSGELNIIANAAECPWRISSNQRWLFFAGRQSGFGSSLVPYTVGYNPGPRREGSLELPGLRTPVFQEEATSLDQCSISIPADPLVVGPIGSALFIDLVIGAGCSWTANNTAPWITVATSGGVGTTRLQVRIQPNASTQSRSSDLLINNTRIRIQQLGVGARTAFQTVIQIPRSSATNRVIEVDLLNTSSSSNRFFIDLIGSAGPLFLTPEETSGEPLQQITIPNNNLRRFLISPSAGIPPGSWLSIRSESSGIASARFSHISVDGQKVVQSGRTLEALTSGFIALDSEANPRSVLSIYNPNMDSIDLDILVRSASGEILGTKVISLPATSVVEGLLSEFFPEANGMASSLKLDSRSLPFAATMIATVGDLELISTLKP
jgi:uncharacterized protein (TIGR03437 family)